MPVTILMRGRTTPESREMGEPAEADGKKENEWVVSWIFSFCRQKQHKNEKKME